MSIAVAVVVVVFQLKPWFCGDDIRAFKWALRVNLYLYCVIPLRGLRAGARQCSVSRRITGIKIKSSISVVSESV